MPAARASCHGRRMGFSAPLMRGLRLHVDYDHRDDPNLPALRLFAHVILDAVDLVRGVATETRALKAGPVEVQAARRWIRNGNVGALTFNNCCIWLGMDAESVRRAILSSVARGYGRSLAERPLSRDGVGREPCERCRDV